MIIAFSAKNKLGFFKGTIERPSNGDSDLKNYWERNITIVISWLLNSISKEISASVIYLQTSAKIWKDLEDRFSQNNGPTIYQLRREMINLKQENNSVSVYFTKLKTIWEELKNFRPACICTCGGSKIYFHIMKTSRS